MPGRAADAWPFTNASVLAVVLATFLIDRSRNPADEALGHVVPAMIGNDQPQFRLELHRTATRGAVRQVLGNLHPPFLS
jgi:hypothetical protein